MAQKEPVLEPGHLCSALFCGKVTRPCVSVSVEALSALPLVPLQTGVTASLSTTSWYSLLKYKSISEKIPNYFHS